MWNIFIRYINLIHSSISNPIYGNNQSTYYYVDNSHKAVFDGLIDKVQLIEFVRFNNNLISCEKNVII